MSKSTAQESSIQECTFSVVYLGTCLKKVLVRTICVLETSEIVQLHALTYERFETGFALLLAD